MLFERFDGNCVCGVLCMRMRYSYTGKSPTSMSLTNLIESDCDVNVRASKLSDFDKSIVFGCLACNVKPHTQCVDLNEMHVNKAKWFAIQ